MKLRSLGLLLTLLLSPPALAAPPANDNYADRITMPATLPSTVTGSNVDATLQAQNERPVSRTNSKSVWWKWTATATQGVAFHTIGSDFDTTLAVYPENEDPQAYPIGYNDNYDPSDPNKTASRMVFQVTAGVAYVIKVGGGSRGEAGNIILSVVPFSAASNDNFAQASVLPADLPAYAAAHNYAATRQPGEPASQGSLRTLWWRWTAPRSGRVLFSADQSVATDGGQWWQNIDVYTGGALNALTRVGSTDADELFYAAVTVTAGTTYHVQVSGDPGLTQLAVEWSTLSNDDFAQAPVLQTGLPITVPVSQARPSLEAGEPNGLGLGGSQWWRWTPNASRLVTFSVADSEDYGASLAVYTGSSLGSLTPAILSFTGVLTIPVTAGVTYHIQAGASSPGHSFALEIREAAAPPNDDFERRQILPPSLPALARGVTHGATSQPNEPGFVSTMSPTIWWSWTAPSSQAVTFATNDSEFDTSLEIYTGSTLSALTFLGSGFGDGDDEEGAYATVNVTAGTTYAIRVSAESDKPETFLSVGAASLADIPYAAWAASNGISSPTADADADGLSNLLEFVLGSSPRSPRGSGLEFIAWPLRNPVSVVSTAGVRRLSYAFALPNDPEALGVRLVAQFSSDAVNWTDVAIGAIQEDPANDRFFHGEVKRWVGRAFDPVPATSNARRFTRLKASLLP
jgi:hypothetical protein